MQNEKYYVPLPEEFHIGFEYYINHNGEPSAVLGKSVFTENTSYLRMGQTLVKYLDSEDIESLGWKESKISNVVKGAEFEISPTGINAEVAHMYKTIEEYGQYHWCIRIKQYSNWFDIFSGTIKNKSELKRLMKQLNITT